MNTDNTRDPYEPLTYEDIRRMAMEQEIAAIHSDDFTVDDIAVAYDPILAPRIPDGVDEATKELIEMLTDHCDIFIGLLAEAIDALDNRELARTMYDAIHNYYDAIEEA